MLTIKEMCWQLTRNRGRSLILLLAAAMLAGCMAFYLGNIRANEEALNDLAKSMDVTVTVANSTGQNQSGLNIATLRYENFTNNPYLKEFRYNGTAVGAYTDEARAKPIASGNDCSIVGVNCMECLWDVTECEFMEGCDETFLEGNEPQCIMFKGFAELHGFEPGDEITLPVYMMYRQQGGGIDYSPIGEQTIKIIGIFDSYAPMQMYVPVQWLREAAEARGVEFFYSYLYGTMKDPMELNHFKAGAMQMSFLPPNPESRDEWAGTCLVVEDQGFINNAEELGQNVLTFKQFQIPFFVLIVGLVVLAIFLIMRGARRDMAIASSLGRPKLLVALGNFLAEFTAELLGCVIILPVMVLGSGLSLPGALIVCGAFLLCASVGNILGLALILRFDAFTLLTATD